MNKPNLFIVGAAKAGTTSLYNYLEAHPEIYMSPIKEPLFFGEDVSFSDFREDHQRNTKMDFRDYLAKKPLKKRHIAFVEKQKDYLALFKEANNLPILGEASTSYLYSEKAAKEIYDFNPKAKVIIILRDPVERTASHFLMDYARGNQDDINIKKVLERDYNTVPKGYCISNLYIDLSLYYDQVQRYLSVFPKDQILILHYDDLIGHTKAILEKIFTFLKVENITVVQTSKFNVTKEPRSKILKHLKIFKPLLPVKIKERLLKNQSLFFKHIPKSTFPEDAKKYVNEIVKRDWEKILPFISRI